MYAIVLLVEEALAPDDLTRIRRLHEGEDLRVRLLVPVDTHHSKVVEVLDDLALGRLRDATHDTGDLPVDQAGAAAQQVLDSSLRVLEAAGVQADGALIGDDPVAATGDEALRTDADEVVVVTAPHLVETTFRRDWGSRLKASIERPVLHFVAGTDRVL